MTMNARDFRLLTVAAVAACVVFVGSVRNASAQGPGVRGGLSVDPDQAYIGAHFETAPLVEHLYFRPNLEVGFGDNVTTTSVNLEFVYKWPLRRSPWTVYAGGGPAINLYSVSDGGHGNHSDGGTDAEGGLNLLGGLQHDNGFFFEVKFGAFDSPDMKLGVGYTWRRH